VERFMMAHWLPYKRKEKTKAFGGQVKLRVGKSIIPQRRRRVIRWQLALQMASLVIRGIKMARGDQLRRERAKGKYVGVGKAVLTGGVPQEWRTRSF